MSVGVQPPSNRPALLPASSWAKVALLLLVLFALLRSVLWASVQPAWLAPDEDYHWLYINYLAEKHTVPDLNGPFYTGELYRGAYITRQGVYVQGPRSDYSGGPKALLPRLAGPRSERKPAPPRPRPVLHPPGYYLGGLAVDLALWPKVSVTRLTGIRYYSAFLGALTIFFAWLLAAQVLAREWQQLAAVAIAATQPILAFSASTITNDVGVAVTQTATLAWCVWMLRAPPRARQGIGLGLLMSLALFTKATNFSLVVVIAAMLWLLWRWHPTDRRELLGIVGWTVALPVVLVGWWYVYLLIKTHSILGETPSLTSGGHHGPGVLHAPAIAAHWLSQVYRSYWFDYLSYEVHTGNVWFWLPLIGIGVVFAGVLVLLWRRWRGSGVRSSPELGQVLLLTLAALVLVVPPFALDTYRAVRGLPFTAEQGRYLLPAYPGLAVIAVVALRELLVRHKRAFVAVIGALVAGAFVNYWHTWIVWVLERFYGPIHGHWLRALWHASFDKPTFVTQNSLAAVLLAALLSFAAAAVFTTVGAWPGRGSSQQGENGAPVDAEDRSKERLTPHPA